MKKDFLTTPLKLSPLSLLLAASVLVALGVGWYARLSNLAFPQHYVFDEAIYIPVARDFVTGTFHLHDHPALLGLLYSLFLRFFDGTPLGWRIGPLIIGLVTQLVIPLAAFRIFKSKIAGTITFGLIAIDPLFIAYSRSALPDILIVLFGTMAIWQSLEKKSSWIVIAALAGMAASVKLNGAFYLPAILAILLWQKRWLHALGVLFGAALTYYTIALGAAVVMGSIAPFQAVVEWQRFNWSFHNTVVLDHPWASRWYTWPLLLVPVKMYEYTDGLQTSYSIFSLPNPPLLWLTTLLQLGLPAGICFALAAKKKKRAFHPQHHFFIILSLSALCTWLPWIFIGRASFWYHYFPAYTLLLMAFSGLLSIAWKVSTRAKILVLICTVLLLICGSYFIPLGNATPLNQGQLMNRILLDSWQHPEPYNFMNTK